ncbi:cytoplasmic protein [Arthrobacter sp. I2-34]|uniref:Cytoplasmic protein n=1 Tax=Arthrobacter hankyongi TaxID=2904801 RepID=A0ABS9L339_9MICC|nr:cytoplasmic protein [Arthrobacter hankyongi]MCG2621068.1 cytoplasmic protein [Arthrobacter hankyongi]
MSLDPVETNPEQYRVVLENDKVRVLEFTDRPGDKTSPHRHPDSVMITLGPLRRRVSGDGREADVVLQAGQSWWLPAQEHTGENTGDWPSHVIFVELKEPAAEPEPPGGTPSR